MLKPRMNADKRRSAKIRVYPRLKKNDRLVFVSTGGGDFSIKWTGFAVGADALQSILTFVALQSEAELPQRLQ